MLSSYTEDEIFTAIKSDTVDYSGISSWFFEKAKAYAIGTWQKKYPRLQEADWKVIFSEVNFKIIKRIKKGLILKKVTLLTYYTELTKYAILDYLSELGKNTNASLDIATIKKVELPTNVLENQELVLQLNAFLEKVTQNKEQVQVLQLFSKGYSYREIVEHTHYKSEGACRNALLKAKKKIIEYIAAHPAQGAWLKRRLQNKD